MALKTYYTNHGSLTTFVYVDKKKTMISFDSSYRGDVGYYTTNDERIQKAIEKDKNFGKKIKLYSKYPEEKSKNNPPIKEINGITTWQEAATYLKENCSVSGLLLRGYQSVIKQAEEQGIYFPDLKEYESE